MHVRNVRDRLGEEQVDGVESVCAVGGFTCLSLCLPTILFFLVLSDSV